MTRVRLLMWSLGLAVAGLLAPAPPALAAPEAAPASQLPRIYLVPVQRAATNVSPLIPRRINARLRVDFGSEQSLEVLAPLAAAKAGGGGSIYRAGPKAEPDLRRAARLSLKGGKQAYEAGRFAEAQKLLLAAVQLFEQSVAHLEDGDALAQAFGYLGLSLLRQNKTAMAADALETAYALNPALKLENLPLPRKVRRLVKAAGRRTLKRRKGRIEVTVDPPGAWVYVDGDEKGKAPFVLKDVLPGRHYVSARLKGRHSRSAVISVKTGATVKVSLTLPDAAPRFSSAQGLAAAFQSELSRRLQTGLVDMRAKPLAAQLATRVRADYLVLGATERAAQGGYLLRTWLFRRQDQKLVELDSFSLDGELLNLTTGTGKVADAVSAAVANFPAARDITYVARPRLRPGAGGGGPTDLVGVVPGGGPTDVYSTRKPWYLRWSFWGTVIGLAVAGGLAGAGVGIYKATHRESSGYRVTVEVP